MRDSVLLLASMALAVLMVSGIAWADTYTVTNTNDSGQGSLRTAIIRANGHPGKDLITFAPDVSGEIRLRSELPQLHNDLEIRGPGANRLTVRRAADEPFRILTIRYATDRTASVKISGLTISNGLTEGSSPGSTRSDGGGILNRGRLVLKEVVVSDNRARGTGGGIVNDDTLTIVDSTISANTNNGIANNDDLTVVRSTFSRNTYLVGGAIINSDNMMVVDSTFSRNTAKGGGAIFNAGFTDGEAVIWGSTFSQNTVSDPAGADGGAIYNLDELFVGNSTFTGNRALGEGPSFGGTGGGAIHNESGALLTVTSSTFTGNTTESEGGGIYNSHGSSCCGGTAHLRATIVANNDAPKGSNLSGPFISRGYNLIGNPNGATGFGDTDLTNSAAGLDPDGLQDNGGPTMTIALLRSSPALDAVEEGCPPPDNDQRGVSRPQNGDGTGAALCDIGAYERQAP